MRRSVEASRGKFQHGLDLFGCSVEPFSDVLDACSGFEVFKDGGYRHPRPAKDPRAADLAGDALHGGALRPIKSHIPPPLSLFSVLPRAGRACHRLNMETQAELPHARSLLKGFVIVLRTSFSLLADLARVQNRDPNEFLVTGVVNQISFHATVRSFLRLAEVDVEHICFLVV